MLVNAVTRAITFPVILASQKATANMAVSSGGHVRVVASFHGPVTNPVQLCWHTRLGASQAVVITGCDIAPPVQAMNLELMPLKKLQEATLKAVSPACWATSPGADYRRACTDQHPLKQLLLMPFPVCWKSAIYRHWWRNCRHGMKW
jgi:hypothetical protein